MIIQRLTKRILPALLLLPVLILVPSSAFAAEVGQDLTGYWAATVSLVVFILAYILVIGEETIHLRKSKPVMVAAGVIWVHFQVNASAFNQ